MTYSHAAVRYLTDTNSDLNKSRDLAIKQARTAGWRYWLDDTPVIRQLYEYGSALQKEYPFLKFWSSTRTRQQEYQPVSNVHVFTEVYICMDTSHHAVGWIGFGSYREKTDSAPMYVVSSRGITNEKYGTGRSQYYMKMTTKLKAATKNALANLIPYTAKEIAVAEYEKIVHKSFEAGESKAAKLPKLLGAITHSILLNEVRALAASGVVFTTPEFQAIVDNMDEAVQLANAERSKRVDMVMVSFVERNGSWMADCAEVLNVRGNRWSPKLSDDMTTYALADVPQPIVEKVSVLQGLDNGGFVDGVGMKLDDKLFWVQK